jgi:hypothetical protein
MIPGRVNLKIYQGSTFSQMFRWESKTLTYANIDTIQKSAPCVIKLYPNQPYPPPSWRVRVTGAQGMKDINLDLLPENYYIVSNVVLTGSGLTAAYNITINEINSLNYGTYTGNGALSWYEPIPLSGYTAVMQIRKSIADTNYEIELTSAAGNIIFDDIDKSIQLFIPSNITRNLNFNLGVYSLEFTDNNNTTITFIQGNVTLIKEVTR